MRQANKRIGEKEFLACRTKIKMEAIKMGKIKTFKVVLEIKTEGNDVNDERVERDIEETLKLNCSFYIEKFRVKEIKGVTE